MRGVRSRQGEASKHNTYFQEHSLLTHLPNRPLPRSLAGLTHATPHALTHPRAHALPAALCMQVVCTGKCSWGCHGVQCEGRLGGRVPHGCVCRMCVRVCVCCMFVLCRCVGVCWCVCVWMHKVWLWLCVCACGDSACAHGCVLSCASHSHCCERSTATYKYMCCTTSIPQAPTPPSQAWHRTLPARCCDSCDSCDGVSLPTRLSHLYARLGCVAAVWIQGCAGAVRVLCDHISCVCVPVMAPQ